MGGPLVIYPGVEACLPLLGLTILDGEGTRLMGELPEVWG